MIQMTRMRAMVCVLVSVILIGGGAFAQGAEDLRRIVIFYNPPNPLVFAGTGITVVHDLWLIKALAVQLPALGTDLALAILQNLVITGVAEMVVHDLVTSVGQITSTPAPTGEKYGWHMDRSRVRDAHQLRPELKGTGVTVAILDTGIDNHPELNIVGGFNALPEGGSYKDYRGHGTHVAGIVAAKCLKWCGVAPNAALLAVKVLDQNGVGRTSDLIKGLQWVFGTGSRLVNMSLQFSDLGSSQDNAPLERATWRLYNEKGVIMVAAAGNHGCHQGPDEGGGDGGESPERPMVCDASGTNVLFPARFPWIIAVTAIDYYNRVPDYCRYGPEEDAVDMAAPGGSKATGIRIRSTGRGGGYTEASGTSQAAPNVTGAVALMLQQQPTLDFWAVRKLLEDTAQDLKQESQMRQGKGLIDVEGIVKKLQ